MSVYVCVSANHRFGVLQHSLEVAYYHLATYTYTQLNIGAKWLDIAVILNQHMQVLLVTDNIPQCYTVC